MKFIMILTSLLMIVFGGILGVAYYGVKDKVMDDMVEKYPAYGNEIAKFLDDFPVYTVIAFLFGICLFVASLFL